MQIGGSVVLVDTDVSTFVYGTHSASECDGFPVWRKAQAVSQMLVFSKYLFKSNTTTFKNHFGTGLHSLLTNVNFWVGLEPCTGRASKRTIPGQRFSLFSIAVFPSWSKCCQLTSPPQRSEHLYWGYYVC